MLATVTPEIANRTAALRGELDQARAIAAQSRAAVDTLQLEQGELAARQTQLAAIEGRQRVAALQSAGSAGREAERALALAEQARDLGSLADDLGRAGRLRDELAALPGPVLRPAQGVPAGPVTAALPVSDGEAAAPPVRTNLRFMLPVQGRIVAGFGAAVQGQPRSRGLSIAVRPDALAIAPAAGRIVFAGPWRGFGQIVIVDHGHGWTSTVTGLARLGVTVGQDVVGGSPLGSAGPGRPVIGTELRQGGEAVNPLDFARL
jgi:septal ring factor EnvC (AmiA/AmiB activator)